jgi:glutathione S-transferase
MPRPVLHGPSYSTYVRTVRLTLHEKDVGYGRNAFDIVGGVPPEQLARHPFGKVPAFAYGDVLLYETFAICRYVDEAFPGPALQPADARDRARMTQAIQVMDNYAFAPAMGRIVLQRLLMPHLGKAPDEAAIAEALPKARLALRVLDGFIGGGAFLAGGGLSLADLHLVPNYHYFMKTPEGAEVLQSLPGLLRWWDAVKTRPSVTETEPEFG